MVSRKLTGYGPSLIVLATAVVVLFAGPAAVRRLTFEQTRAQIIQASDRLVANDILSQLNQAYRDIAAVVEPSVVHVSTQYLDTDQFGVGRPGISSGSGWIYDGHGHIVTNHHVIANAQRIEVQLYNGELRQAMLVGSDPTTDIAVIKVSPERIHPAVLGDVDQPVNQGDMVFAFGSPFDFRFSMSSGVVSGKGRSVGVIRDETGGRRGYENFIQVDAAINPGNSGGPLTDYRGRVIGMNTAIATGRRNSLEDGQFAGIGLAIPIDMIVPAVSQIIEHGFVTKGFLGVDPIEIPPVIAQQRGFIGNGVMIVGVEPTGPAWKSGVKAEDIVTHVSGKSVASVAQLRSVVSSMLPGENATLKIWRFDATKGAANELEIVVPLERYDTLRQNGTLPPDHPRDSLEAFGIARMTTSTPDLARRHEAQFVAGVTIEQLVPGSRLARRILPGTTIVEVRGFGVRDIDEFFAALANFNLNQPLGVPVDVVLPDGTRETVPLRLE